MTVEFLAFFISKPFYGLTALNASELTKLRKYQFSTSLLSRQNPKDTRHRRRRHNLTILVRCGIINMSELMGQIIENQSLTAD